MPREGGRARASGHHPPAGHGLLQLIPPSLRLTLRGVYPLLLLMLLSSLAFRILLACGTSGSDVPQFLAFAETMDYCIYSSGHPAGHKWPYPWPYPYGPLLLVLLRGVHTLVCPCGLEFHFEGEAYSVIVDPRWACALKSVYTLADAVIAAAIFYAVGGLRGFLAAAIYAYSPFTVYVSSVYGMFDPIPVALLALSIILASRGKMVTGGILAGIALGFKQTALPPLLTLSVTLPASYTLAWLSAGSLPYASVLLACPGDTGFLHDIARMLGSPSFPRPIVYSMNGIMSMAAILYDRGYEWASAIPRLWPILYIALLAPALYASLKSRDPFVAAALGSAAFTASYWRVNPQYVVATVAFILMAAPRLTLPARIPAFSAVVAASAWGLLYPQGFWGRVHMPKETWQARLLDSITYGPTSDTAYAIVELALTLSLWVMVWVEAACRRRTC